MESTTAVFAKRVADVARRRPLALPPETELSRAIGEMTAAKASAAAIVDGEHRPLGILTEQDVVRRIALRADGKQPLTDVMSAPVVCIRDDEFLYYAVARMRRLGHRHMPVVDADGRLAGMLDLHDAIAITASALMAQIDDLTRDDSLDGLRQIKVAQVTLADQLLAEGMPVEDIQALLTHVNNDIYARVVARALAEMRESGRGEPPVRFAVIVMGSGGRGENFVYPDQDNGFIIDDYGDAEHARIDGWFIDLAERMTGMLDTVGFPLCKGYVMATNPLWRKRRSEWREQIALWSRKRNTVALRLCDIFFDFRAVWGEQAFADELKETVLARTRGHATFLREMWQDDDEHGPALGWFDRFITVRQPAAYKGTINLKHSGSLPLVEAIRLLALREGLRENGTLARMAALHEGGVLDVDEHDYLVETYRLIAGLNLRCQVDAFLADSQVTNYVHPRDLTRREREQLKAGFKAIRRLRDRLRAEFTGAVF